MGQALCRCQSRWLLELGTAGVGPYLLPIGRMVIHPAAPPVPRAVRWEAHEGVRAEEV